MSDSLNWKLEQLEHAPLDGEPDYEAMWSRIEERRAKAQETQKAPVRRFARHRKKALVLAASVSLLAAIPVLAAVNGGWETLWNGRSSVHAIEQGFGERLNQTVTSGQIPITLNGVATDDRQMNLLLTVDAGTLPAYDAIEFEKRVLTDAKNKAETVQMQLRNDPAQGRMFGLASVQNKLGKAKQSFRLDLENLVFYQYRGTPVDLSPLKALGKRTALAGGPAASIEVTSAVREGNVYSVRYKLHVKDDDAWKANPHLTLVSGGQTIRETYAAVLPSEDPNVILRQSNFELSDAELQQARFELSALVETGRKEGAWHFAFDADGKKAAQAMYVGKLDPAAVANDSIMAFTNLVVTPLEIRLMYDEVRNSFPKEGTALVDYTSVKLLVDGRELDSGSGFWMTEDGGRYRRFELPEWYEQKDWGQLPMKAILSGKKVQERAPEDHLLTLARPSADKQTVTTELHGFPVTFTYYKEGSDLLVESSSSDPSFGGITQSYLNIGGERMYAELNPTPPGGNGTNRKTERYINVPSGDLKLNPFLFVWFDPDAKVELNLR
ncbi:hypothetical protein J31TS4_38230 [Paenibacillus sp. J31TS4]|uniref:DUF4179 domain-containing protein n=1 Tax=Paenibacillus sp. J31TS4 TaxID=2807195 RepID=UPI001B12C95F|nr:DUF4179 domain-containing protein [Paenibacillus sp. J31TS4]GIP40543.1 hypothetical protein J31TS4_38230 [Paenibacillus sp. J31TS4]